MISFSLTTLSWIVPNTEACKPSLQVTDNLLTRDSETQCRMSVNHREHVHRGSNPGPLDPKSGVLSAMLAASYWNFKDINTAHHQKDFLF